MNTTVQVEIGSGKQATSVFHLVLERDHVVDTVSGPAPEPDFTVRIPDTEVEAVVGGRLPLDEGYMQGRLKVTGNVGRMLSVLPVLLGESWRQAVAAAVDTSV